MRWTGSLAAAILLVACAGPESPDPEETSTVRTDGAAPQASPVLREQVFDRELLFLSSLPDSVVQVPWFFRTRSHAGAANQARSAWLVQGGSWEVLVQEGEETPPTRTPWRILPGEKIRLIVADDDRIASLVFRDPPREVETELGELLAEWIRPGREPALLYRGRTVFPSGAVDGVVLDFSRRWTAPEETHGDWIFLHGEGGLYFFMEEQISPEEPRHPARYRGWGYLPLQDGMWTDISVQWAELRTFERARRDIPSRWTFSSAAGEVAGVLVSLSSHLSAGEGEGPILPVNGLFEVEGTLTIQGEETPVSGMVRHVQR